jgi:hypothetical protein
MSESPLTSCHDWLGYIMEDSCSKNDDSRVLAVLYHLGESLKEWVSERLDDK